MNELDELWGQMIAEAAIKARASGSGDVAEYLAVKAANDQIRAASVAWLFDAAAAIAASNRLSNILTESENPHRFQFGIANLAGSLVRFRQGVRCLTIEAGWTRTPADGFMRGGALACARLTHFGIGKANEDLLLIKIDDVPQWIAVDIDGRRADFNANNLQKHFQIFLGAD